MCTQILRIDGIRLDYIQVPNLLGLRKTEKDRTQVLIVMLLGRVALSSTFDLAWYSDNVVWMLHANLKAICLPQTASMWVCVCGGGGGGGGNTGVHCCGHSGILEELLSVFDNQVVWFECRLSTVCVGLCELQLRFMVQKHCPMWHKNVLCGTKMSHAFLLIMNGAPSHMSNGQNH